MTLSLELWYQKDQLEPEHYLSFNPKSETPLVAHNELIKFLFQSIISKGEIINPGKDPLSLNDIRAVKLISQRLQVTCPLDWFESLESSSKLDASKGYYWNAVEILESTASVEEEAKA